MHITNTEKEAVGGSELLNLFYCLFVCFETEFHSGVTVLKFILWRKLALSSQRLNCLCLRRADVKGAHHTQPLTSDMEFFLLSCLVTATSHTVAQLTSSLQKLNFCFWLSSARILGASHHTQPVLFYKKKKWICLLYFICMRFCLLDWLCTMCGSGVRGGQKGCPISWNWNYGWPPAGAGSWAWVLCKNNKRS